MSRRPMSAVREVLLTLVSSVKAAVKPAAKAPPTAAVTAKAQAQAKTPAPTATPQPDPLAADYPVRRDAAQALLTALQTHRQAAHVAAETASATAALLLAKTHADAAQWPQALAEVEKARKACADGKGFADAFDAFMGGPRREAGDAIAAATAAGLAVGPQQTLLASADAKAAPATRDFAGATADARRIGTDLGAALAAKYVTPAEGKVATHKASAVKDFLKPLTDDIDALLAQQKQFIAGKAFGQVRLAAIRIDAQLVKADKMAPRRLAFQVQRPKTVVELDKVKAVPALAAPQAALVRRLQEADREAGYDVQHMDDAERELKAMAADCEAYLKLHADAAAYSTERKARADAMAALDRHTAAPLTVKEREAVRGLLADAVAAAGDPGAPGTALQIQVDRGRHDLAQATRLLAEVKFYQSLAAQLSDGLDGVATAQDAMGDTPTAGSLDKAIKALKGELASARKGPHADLSAKEFDAAQAGIAQAEKSLKAKALPAAAEALTAAGGQLAAGRRLQVEHAHFAQQHQALAARLADHRKLPEAPKLKPALDAFQKALDDAAAQDRAGDFVQALALLRGAEAAAARADDALVHRDAFDTREAAVRAALNGADFASLKVAQLAKVDAAKALADALDFAGADKGLDGVEAEMAAADVARLAKASPNDAALIARAKDLKKKGGNAALDKLIAALPTDVTKDVFTALAKERFGVEVMSTDGDSANTAAALQQMCKLFAQVPDVVMDNPSLKKVQHTGAGGASYNAENSLVKMNSRPAPNSKADFQKDASGNLPSTRLPADREELCKPANDKPEDLFDFNSIHEVAHSIDDANNFMNSRLGANNTEFAGWVIHGGDVQPIADAVARKYHYDKNADQVRYVLDLIVGNPLVVPLDDTGAEPADWKAARDNVHGWYADATDKNVWSNQAKSMNIDIDGRIYQESYASKWMSYQTAARKRGITGYQFRAPGEWFSELFAAYKLGKLKQGHPSEGWLSKLKI